MKQFRSLLLAVALACGLATATPIHRNTSSISTTNPFQGFDFFVSPVYRSEVLPAAAKIAATGDLKLANRALTVATKISTFLWISDSATVSKLPGWLAEARLIQAISGHKQVVQIEVYNLPDRDCSAGASAGEFSYANGGEQKYQQYIQSIASILKQYSDIRVVIGLETDSIGNLVTNLSVPKCGDNAAAQKRSLAYAIANLQLSNVAIYVDGAHAGWLGWDSNIGPAADLIAEIVNDAKALNPSAVIRGVATDVSNYNGLGNQPQMGYDELPYVRNLHTLLSARGLDAHFIVDQGRSGVQNYTRTGSDWCNNKYAGFGPLPTTHTPDSVVDAIVWVKPGGESDGTSDSTAARYDPSCGSDSSLIPAPEAGTWFQAYFVQLLKNANPPIAPLI